MSIELENINGGTGDSGGGGSAKFPMIVTSSGSSLPIDLSGYSAGDTFLNTSDKKIYEIQEVTTYKTNTNVTNTATLDLITGVASGFGSNKNIYRTNSDFLWTGNKELKIHFKETQIPTGKYHIFKCLTSSGTSGKEIRVYLQDSKIYFALTHYEQSPAYAYKTTEIAEISANVEYYLKITKTGTSGKAELFTDSYEGTLVASVNFDTEDYIMSGQTTSTIYYNENSDSFYSSPNQYLNVYLLDSTGEFLVVDTVGNTWVEKSDITEGQYLDTTNGILYFYKDDTLSKVPSVAETTTIDTASVTISEIKANTNYVFSNNAITNITLSGCETSFEETSIEFTLPADISNFSFTDNSGITWVDGSPTFNASKSYLIVIFNKLGFVKEY